MTDADELDSYRKVLAVRTPENPRREIDIQASLQAFDAAQTPRKPRLLPDWLRLPVLLGAGAAVMAVVVTLAYLPQDGQPLNAPPMTAPDLRLALPAEPPAAPARDAQVLTAFGADLPQYFPLPWDRKSVLALLEGEKAETSETLLFAAEGRRLVVTARGAQLTGARGQDEGYQRFAVALAGVALRTSGVDLGPDWPLARLLTEAQGAAKGNPAREAALSAITSP